MEKVNRLLVEAKGLMSEACKEVTQWPEPVEEQILGLLEDAETSISVTQLFIQERK